MFLGCDSLLKIQMEQISSTPLRGDSRRERLLEWKRQKALKEDTKPTNNNLPLRTDKRRSSLGGATTTNSSSSKRRQSLQETKVVASTPSAAKKAKLAGRASVGRGLDHIHQDQENIKPITSGNSRMTQAKSFLKSKLNSATGTSKRVSGRKEKKPAPFTPRSTDSNIQPSSSKENLPKTNPGGPMDAIMEEDAPKEEDQPVTPVSMASVSSPPSDSDASSTSGGEVDLLVTEVATLRMELSRSEVKVVQLTSELEQAQKSVTVAEAAAKEERGRADAAEVARSVAEASMVTELSVVQETAAKAARQDIQATVGWSEALEGRRVAEAALEQERVRVRSLTTQLQQAQDATTQLEVQLQKVAAAAEQQATHHLQEQQQQQQQQQVAHDQLVEQQQQQQQRQQEEHEQECAALEVRRGEAESALEAAREENGMLKSYVEELVTMKKASEKAVEELEGALQQAQAQAQTQVTTAAVAVASGAGGQEQGKEEGGGGGELEEEELASSDSDEFNVSDELLRLSRGVGRGRGRGRGRVGGGGEMPPAWGVGSEVDEESVVDTVPPPASACAPSASSSSSSGVESGPAVGSGEVKEEEVDTAAIEAELRSLRARVVRLEAALKGAQKGEKVAKEEWAAEMFEREVAIQETAMYKNKMKSEQEKMRVLESEVVERFKTETEAQASKMVAAAVKKERERCGAALAAMFSHELDAEKAARRAVEAELKALKEQLQEQEE